MAPKRKSAASAEPATEQISKLKKTIDEGAEELLCPITQELPIDPVTAEDGRVYERSAITEWLQQNEKSPHTNEPMGKQLLPATQVKNLISGMVRSGAITGDKAGAWTKCSRKRRRSRRCGRRRSEANWVLWRTYLSGTAMGPMASPITVQNASSGRNAPQTLTDTPSMIWGWSC